MILFQDDAVRQFQEAGLKTFCYNIHWFKMKPKPKWAELTKDIDLRNFGLDGDLQSGSSMIQFLIEKGAVYHKCCSDKFSKRTRERNSSGFKLTPQNSSETILLFSKSRTDSRVVDTINQDHGSYCYSPHLKRQKLDLPPQRRTHAQSSSFVNIGLSALPVSTSRPVAVSTINIPTCVTVPTSTCVIVHVCGTPVSGTHFVISLKA